VPQHITAHEVRQCLSERALDWSKEANFLFLGLHAYLTRILSTFSPLWWYLKTKINISTFDITGELSTEIKNMTSTIRTFASLCVREHGGHHLEHLLHKGKKQTRLLIVVLFVLFLYTHKPSRELSDV
jgi:hypothetical protein